MSENPRFVIEMSIRDTHGYEPPIHRAIGVDEAMRISSRMVDEMKLGVDLGAALGFNDVVELIRTKELRRDVLKRLAVQLAGQMADRLEDAEGWHDPSRVEPARKELGGRWG